MSGGWRRRAWQAAAWVAAAAALWTAAGWAAVRLLEERDARHLTQAPAVENLPPGAAFVSVALGGFRGILADLLWMRAGRMQDEGRYFELVQLSEWIARLQPRSPEIWAYHAWNMAYNLSAMMEREEDAWRWVESGLRLLREDGLRENPGSTTLHRELSWMYLHKVGSDDDHRGPYYRARLAAGEGRGELPDAAAKAELERMFGPLDWGTASAQAMYWAWTGLPYARTDREDLDLRRLVYQGALQLVYARGERWRLGKLTAFVEDFLRRHPTATGTAELLQRLRENAG